MPPPPDVAALHAAFASGAVTPAVVADRFLAAGPVGGAVDAFVSVVAAQVQAQAAEATERLRVAGRGEGPLAGVLVGVKDVFGVEGHVTRGGTRVFGDRPDRDAEVVRRLRRAGAVIAGKTRMTELGLSPFGPNPSGGTPRNPHDAARVTGGSSSGSAAAVAAGLVPLAIGTDGGGSCRFPAAFCGVFGFKPSFGAVPDDDALATGWWSLASTGPIARTAQDLATGFAVLADRPPVDLTAADGARVGLDEAWWGDPAPDVDARCRDAASSLAPKPVEIDPGALALARPAEYVTVGAEVAAALHDVLRDAPQRLGPDVQALLQSAQELTAVEYVRAQQARRLLADVLATAFDDVDLLVTPTTALTAPALPAVADRTGVVDARLLEAVTAYALPANLCGLPAATVPVGVDRDGLPVGLQVLGPPGADELVLAACARLEREAGAAAPPPRTTVDLLAA